LPAGFSFRIAVRTLLALRHAAEDFALQSRPHADAHRGRKLFERVWTPEKCDKGDGLGPLYHERSCVACHSQGGIGDAGPNSKNVDLVSVDIPERLREARGADGEFLPQPTHVAKELDALRERGSSRRSDSAERNHLSDGAASGNVSLMA